MKKISKIQIILMVLYFVVLYAIFGVYVKFVNDKTTWISVVASQYQSRERNNMMLIEAGDTNDEHHFENHSVLINWVKDDVNAEPSNKALPENGRGLYTIPERPNRLFKHWKSSLVVDKRSGSVMDCADLQVSLLNEPARNYHIDLTSTDKSRIDKHTVKSVTIPCPELMFDDTSLYVVPRFDYGYYKPQNELRIVVPSAFIPGKSNEILFVDIHDGEPFEGEIDIEPKDGASGAESKIVLADPSGITSISLTIQQLTDYRITAGDDTVEATFVPLQRPFHVEIDDYRITNHDNRPKARVIQAGEPKDVIIDYFVGYAWIYRQTIPSNKLDEPFALTLGPGYSFKEEAEIIYARFSTSEFPSEEQSQTIALIANKDQTNTDFFGVGEHTNAREQFSAIFQDYIKLDNLNHLKLMQSDSNSLDKPYTYYNSQEIYRSIDKIYKNHDAQSAYDIFNVAYTLKNITQNGSNKDSQYTLKCHQFRKYLLTRLVESYHPKVGVLAGFPDEEKAKFEQARHRHLIVISIIRTAWLLAGVIVFVVLAMRIRNRRQQAWFDDAAKGKSEGVLPGTPAWTIVIIIMLSLGLIFSVFFMVPLL